MSERSTIRNIAFKGAVPLIAITALTTVPANRAEATAESRAAASALKICNELYDPNDLYSKGVPVKGILNGFVVINDHRTGSLVKYRHPVLLTRSAGTTNKDGAWIGIPTSPPDGRTCLQPMKIDIGTHDGSTERIHFQRHEPPIRNDSVLIYPTPVSGGPDQLFAYGADGSFANVAVTAAVDK